MDVATEKEFQARLLFLIPVIILDIFTPFQHFKWSFSPLSRKAALEIEGSQFHG